jgi:putative ABC transport system permease protein
LAVGNGLLVVLGSIATGLKQREADAVINKMLGKARPAILTTALVQYLVLGLLAAIPAMVVGLGLGWLVSRLLTDVEFTAEAATLFSVVIASIALTGALGAATLLRATTAAPARLLREL